MKPSDIKIETGQVIRLFFKAPHPYGHAVTNTGEIIYFKFSHGRHIDVGREQPQFSYFRCDCPPNDGDGIVFVRDPRKTGKFASVLVWGHANLWNKKCGQSVNPSFFRVIRQQFAAGKAVGTEETLVEGTVMEIVERYPRGLASDMLTPGYYSERSVTWQRYNSQAEKYVPFHYDPRPVPFFEHGVYGKKHPAPPQVRAAMVPATPSDQPEKPAPIIDLDKEIDELHELANSVNGRNRGTRQFHRQARITA